MTVSWIYGDPPDPDVLAWALTGPWPACPRCGVELKQVRWRTHGWREEVGHQGHRAPCGQRCLPGMDTWVGDCGAPHISNATCWKCKDR